MKKKILSIILALAVLLSAVGILTSCEGEVDAPGVSPSSVVPVSSDTYNLGRTGKYWKSLYLADNITTDNSTEFELPDLGDVTDTLVSLTSTGTMTNKTLTSPTITNPTVSTGTFTTPTINTATIGTGANITAPNILGTPAVANHASGNATVAAGSSSVTVTHGLSGTPSRVYWSWSGAYPGTAADATAFLSVYWGAATSTSFTFTFGTSTNVTTGINWYAMIADE